MAYPYRYGHTPQYQVGGGYAPEKPEFVSVQEVGPVDDGMRGRLEDLRESDAKWRRYAQRLTFVYRLAATLLSAFVLGTLIYALEQYLTTKNLTLHDGTEVWPNNLVLWPTYLLLGVSLLTFVTNGLLLFVPCMHHSSTAYDTVSPYQAASTKAARKRTSRLLSASQYLAIGLYFVAWAVSSGLYQFANTGGDLWGCTCSSGATQIQPQVQSFLNFGRLCSVQGAGWHVMIAQAAVWALAGATYIVAVWRWRRRKVLRKLEHQATIRDSVISYIP